MVPLGHAHHNNAATLSDAARARRLAIGDDWVINDNRNADLALLRELLSDTSGAQISASTTRSGAAPAPQARATLPVALRAPGARRQLHLPAL